MNRYRDVIETYYKLEDKYYSCWPSRATHYKIAIYDKERMKNVVESSEYIATNEKDSEMKTSFAMEECIRKMNKLYPGWENK